MAIAVRCVVRAPPKTSLVVRRAGAAQDESGGGRISVTEGIMAHAMTYYAAIGAIAPERHELFSRSARCPITACSAFGVRVPLWPATAQMGAK